MCRPQGGGAADGRRDQQAIGVDRELVLVEPTSVGGEPHQDASASSQPDLVRKPSDRLHVRHRNSSARVAANLHESHRIRFPNDQRISVAGELELTRMEHCPHRDNDEEADLGCRRKQFEIQNGYATAAIPHVDAESCGAACGASADSSP